MIYQVLTLQKIGAYTSLAKEARGGFGFGQFGSSCKFKFRWKNQSCKSFGKKDYTEVGQTAASRYGDLSLRGTNV